MAKSSAPVSLTFELVGDQFEHAWFFNRFRVDRLGDSYLVTFCLVSDSGGTPAVNAIVLSEADLKHNKDRALEYLTALADVSSEGNFGLSFSAPPQRVYPVNHMNLARVDKMAEIGFFRFSVNTLVDRMRETRTSKKEGKVETVKCYPVVMFRSDLSTQVALLKELYTT